MRSVPSTCYLPPVFPLCGIGHMPYSMLPTSPLLLAFWFRSVISLLTCSFKIDRLSDVPARTNHFALYTDCSGSLRFRSHRPPCPDTLHQGMAHRRAGPQRWHNACPCAFSRRRLACRPACPPSCCQQQVVRLVGDLACRSFATVHHRRWINLRRHDPYNQGAGILDPCLASYVWGCSRCTPQRVHGPRAWTWTLT